MIKTVTQVNARIELNGRGKKEVELHIDGTDEVKLHIDSTNEFVFTKASFRAFCNLLNHAQTLMQYSGNIPDCEL